MKCFIFASLNLCAGCIGTKCICLSSKIDTLKITCIFLFIVIVDHVFLASDKSHCFVRASQINGWMWIPCIYGPCSFPWLVPSNKILFSYFLLSLQMFLLPCIFRDLFNVFLSHWLYFGSMKCIVMNVYTLLLLWLHI